MYGSRHREKQPAPGPRAPEPVPPDRAGALDWASAIGNQAVARLARQATEDEITEPEAPLQEAEEAPPPEVALLESQGIGMEAVAGLDAVDALAEDDLPG